jgi:cytochrome c553
MKLLSSLMLLPVLTSPLRAADEAATALAGQVKALFQAKCATCHSATGAEPKQPQFLDNFALLAEYMDVKKPEESGLYTMLQEGDMPKTTKVEKLAGNRATPLNSTELATVVAWIRAGAPAPAGAAAPPSASAPAAAPAVPAANPEAPRLIIPDPATQPKPAPRRILTEAEVTAGAVQDLLSLPPEEQRGTRYLSLLPQQNNSTEVTPEELAASRQAIRKLLNSLSKNPQLASFPAVGPEGVLHRIRLRDLGENWTPALWDSITASYPYALDGQALGAAAVPAGCPVPVVRADWFAATASRPPLYDQILQHPENVKELEKQLGIDLNANLAAGEAVRAAFTHSGISQQNRMVEQHAIRKYAGSFWLSYDFKTNAGRGRVIDFPLGPVDAHLLDGSLAFEHAGGEIIHNLPNGLQAYLLVDGQGKRINEAPIEVVQDRSASRKTSHSQISNGLSCIACHDNGMQPLPADEVRPLAGTHGAAAQRLIERLYPEARVTEATLEVDRKRFLEALRQADAGASAVKEPVQALVDDFEKDLNLARAAAELGLEPAALEKTLASTHALFSTKVQLGSGGVPRLNFTDHFTQIAVRLGLGTPRDVAPPSKVLVQLQDPFGVKRERGAVIAVELVPSVLTTEGGVEKLIPGTIFKEGDLMAVTVRSNEDAHLRIFAKTPSGKLVTLFPNANSDKTSTFIKANTPVQVPDAAAEFELVTEGPEFGEETLIAVVSNQPFTDDTALLADVTKSAAKGGFASYGTDDAEGAITKSFRARAKGSRVGVARVKVSTLAK